MTTNDIDAARKLTDAATPGPWIADGWEIYEDVERNWVAETLDTDNHERSYADAEFIAAARTLVPALCDEVEQLRAELETKTAVAKSNARHAAILTEIVERVDQLVQQHDQGNGAFVPIYSLRVALNGATKTGAEVAR